MAAMMRRLCRCDYARMRLHKGDYADAAARARRYKMCEQRLSLLGIGVVNGYAARHLSIGVANRCATRHYGRQSD